MAKDDNLNVWELFFVFLFILFMIGILAICIYVVKEERRRRLGEMLQNAYKIVCDKLGKGAVQLLILFLTSLALQMGAECFLDSANVDLFPQLPLSTIVFNAFLGSLLGCGFTCGYEYIHTLDGRRSALVASGVSIIFVLLKAVFIARVIYVAIIAGILGLMISVFACEKSVHKSQRDQKNLAFMQSAAIFGSGLLLGHELGWASLKLGPGALIGAPASIRHLYDTTTVVLIFLGAAVFNECDAALTAGTFVLGAVGINICCLIISSELLGKQSTGIGLLPLMVLSCRVFHLSTIFSTTAVRLMKENDPQEPKPVKLEV